MRSRARLKYSAFKEIRARLLKDGDYISFAIVPGNWYEAVEIRDVFVGDQEVFFYIDIYRSSTSSSSISTCEGMQIVQIDMQDEDVRIVLECVYRRNSMVQVLKGEIA